jgi:hypothetical protein
MAIVYAFIVGTLFSIWMKRIMRDDILLISITFGMAHLTAWAIYFNKTWTTLGFTLVFLGLFCNAYVPFT